MEWMRPVCKPVALEEVEEDNLDDLATPAVPLISMRSAGAGTQQRKGVLESLAVRSCLADLKVREVLEVLASLKVPMSGWSEIARRSWKSGWSLRA